MTKEEILAQGVTFTRGEVETAKRVLAFYNNDPKRWTQLSCARNKAGKPLSSSDISDFNAVCWCPFGVAMEINLPEVNLWTGFRKAKNDPDFRYIRWNDEPNRTFHEVRDLLESIANGLIAE